MSAPPVRGWLLLVARAAFLLLLLAGVAAHGGTMAATRTSLEWCTVLVAVVYGAGKVIQDGRLPGWGVLPSMVLLLAILGWLSACNAGSVFEQDLRIFLPVAVKPWWPWGSVDGTLSISTMRRITGMLGVLLMASDMGMEKQWRRMTMMIMACCGVAVAVFGLAQRLDGDIGNYWGTQGTSRFRDTVFGCFWYHGNAGAFLNLCWPLMAWMTWRAFSSNPSSSPGNQLRKAMHIVGLVVIMGAVWINHSKAAQAIFLLESAALLFLLVGRSSTGTGISGRLAAVPRTKLLLGATFVVAITLVALSFGLEETHDAWGRFRNGGLTRDGRWVVVRTCLKWWHEIPCLGYGPGTFQAVFLVKTKGLEDAPPGYWEFAHNDYLQTFLEWGWTGLLLWVVLGLIILRAPFAALCRMAGTAPLHQRAGLAAITAALFSVAVHAAVDFPLQIFAIQLYTATLAGCGLGMVRRTAPRDFPDERSRKRPTRVCGDRENHAGAP